jgi:glycine cleavage system H protein
MDLKNFRFSKDHEWVKIEGEIARVGVSDYAQKEMGDVVYVELPEIDSEFEKGDPCSNIESVKAVNDIFTPLSGVITGINNKLEDSPENVNQDPYGNGWIFEIRFSNPKDMDDMMTPEEYEEYLKGI